MTWPYVWAVEPVWTVEGLKRAIFSIPGRGGMANDTSCEE